MSFTGRLLAAGAAIVLAAGVSTGARADAAEDYFKGKTINIVVGYGPEGGYAVYCQQLVAYFGKHIAGNPTVIGQFMPGQGGVKAASYLYSVAPKDGNYVGMLSDYAAVAQLTVWLDHAWLRAEQAKPRETGGPAAPRDDQSEEILKLSEALFAQDIELLRSNEKIGKIEKLKNDFIEKMSRELRTPLNSIIEGIIAVLTGENDQLSDGAKQTLRSALDEGSAFLRTLQNILDLWRIKQNELPVEMHDINFRETVEEAIFSIQDAIGDKPIAVEQHIVEPFPRIRTDLAKVNQILFLLLDNAAKFTPEGRIEIRASIEDDELQCEVRDTGIGICPDDQQFIFDEFFQVDVASSTTYTGAGLGLALVRDMIALLDGEVAVTSDVGRGTAVTFRIPVQVIG